MGRWNLFKRVVAVGTFVGGVFACSSGTGSANPGVGSTFDCGSYCQKVSSVCTQYTAQQCSAECQEAVSEIGSCGSQLNAYASCAISKGALSCDSDGDVQVAGCDSELNSYVTCYACQPQSGDDACDTCQRQQCCSKLAALATHPQAQAFDDCQSACTTSECDDQCEAQYASYVGAREAYLECVIGCQDKC